MLRPDRADRNDNEPMEVPEETGLNDNQSDGAVSSGNASNPAADSPEAGGERCQDEASLPLETFGGTPGSRGVTDEPTPELERAVEEAFGRGMSVGTATGVQSAPMDRGQGDRAGAILPGNTLDVTGDDGAAGVAETPIITRADDLPENSAAL